MSVQNVHVDIYDVYNDVCKIKDKYIYMKCTS